MASLISCNIASMRIRIERGGGGGGGGKRVTLKLLFLLVLSYLFEEHCPISDCKLHYTASNMKVDQIISKEQELHWASSHNM